MVLLGRNVGHDGDLVEGVGGEVAAMYFVVVVSVSEEEAKQEVDVGPVIMHRKLAKLVSMGAAGMKFTTFCRYFYGCCTEIPAVVTTLTVMAIPTGMHGASYRNFVS